MAQSSNQTQKAILAALDLGPRSSSVLQKALSLAKQQKRPVLALHVVHETAESAGFYKQRGNANVTQPMADIAQELLDAQIQEVLATLDESAARIEIERRVVEGIPENRIVEIAEQIDAALLVMAADTERSLLGKWWSGSVVDSVKKHTERPLVILPNELPSLPQTERKDLHHNTMQFTH